MVFSAGSVTATVLKLPVMAPVLCRKLNELLGDGRKPLSLLMSIDPASVVLPDTLSRSKPEPGVVPPSSKASVLSAPKVRLPSILSAPGEKPGASVPPFMTTLPPIFPVPARKPPLNVATAPVGRIRLAKVPWLPRRV